MTDQDYYSTIEQLLENNIKSIKKMSYLIQDSDGLIRRLSKLVDKTRQLQSNDYKVENDA